MTAGSRAAANGGSRLNLTLFRPPASRSRTSRPLRLFCGIDRRFSVKLFSRRPITARYSRKIAKLFSRRPISARYSRKIGKKVGHVAKLFVSLANQREAKEEKQKKEKRQKERRKNQI